MARALLRPRQRPAGEPTTLEAALAAVSAWVSSSSHRLHAGSPPLASCAFLLTHGGRACDRWAVVAVVEVASEEGRFRAHLERLRRGVLLSVHGERVLRRATPLGTRLRW